MEDDNQRLFGKVFVLFGVGFISIGLALGWSASSFVRHARSAPGRVVELQPQVLSGSVSYLPVIEYQTDQGRRVRFSGKIASSPPAYSIGEQVDVLYDPDEPQQARIDSFAQTWLLPGALCGMGLLFGAIGLPFRWPGLLRRRRGAGFDSPADLDPAGPETKGQWRLRWISFTAGGLGICLLAAGLSWRTIAFRARARSAPGRVVEFARFQVNGSPAARPVIEFQSQDGRTIRFSAELGSTEPTHQLGQEVGVLYDPESPEQARIDSWLQNWFATMLTGGMGLLFTAIGQGIFWRRLLRPPREPRRS